MRIFYRYDIALEEKLPVTLVKETFGLAGMGSVMGQWGVEVCWGEAEAVLVGIEAVLDDTDALLEDTEAVMHAEELKEGSVIKISATVFITG